MNSAQYLTWFLILSVLVVFPIWEFLQLYRRRKGNKSARTMSQYIGYRIKHGSRGWLIFSIAFPIFILLVMIWLLPHWGGLCAAFGWLCDLDI